jgi:electron transport complex protein RnfC
LKVYSFPRGGISFEDPAVPSRTSFVTAFLPSFAVIPLVQHPGGRAYPVVSIGETVREGMLIGRGQGTGSANIHATVPGKVVKMVSWKMVDGRNNDALVIRMEGGFERLGKREEIFPWEGMLPYDLQRQIAENGIVEMEGSGRPVTEILSSLKSVQEPVSLVVRCVFDDPWLAADYVLCMERFKAVVEGSRIIARIARAERIIFALSQGEEDLGKKFISEAGNWMPPSSLVLVGSRYPQRNQRELELALRNYGKKEGIDPGFLLILGPATLAAVHDAVKLKRPILDRYVAAGGTAVKNPQVMKVRIGTRISEIFNECGGFIGNPRQIACGSPFLGKSLADLNEPVTKTSYAVFALLEEKQPEDPSGSCIGCGECRNVCPVGLDPEELYKRTRIERPKIERPKIERAKIEWAKSEAPYGLPESRAAECHGCGCCNVVCPSRLPLSSAIVNSALRGN